MAPDINDVPEKFVPEVEVIVPKPPDITAKKIQDLAERVKYHLPPDVRSGETVGKFKTLVGMTLSEESTDLIIEIITGPLPTLIRWPASKALDYLLPERLLGIIFTLLDRISD